MAAGELTRAARRWAFRFGSDWCHRTLSYTGKSLSVGASGPFLGHKRTVQDLWQDFFSDPSQWWDHRLEKGNARYPDFKHKTKQEALWLNNKLNPPWVEAELATMAPGSVQCGVFTWNMWLAKSMKAGDHEKTLQLFHQMQQGGIKPDRFTFVPVLNACASLRRLEEGELIHRQIIQRDCESDLYVCNSLIDMYAKCGNIENARQVFDKITTHDVVAWNAMIHGYVKCGHGKKALELSQQMQDAQVEPDPFTYVGLLNACASLRDLGQGKHIHMQIIQSVGESDLYLGNSLVDMYVKCGSMGNALQVFNDMPVRDVVSWTTIIQGYVKCGQEQMALDIYWQMRQESVKPDPYTFVGVLNSCASMGALEEGRAVHTQIIQNNCESDVLVGSTLVYMYAKCGSLEEAWRAFNKMPRCNVAPWNAMILGHVKCGQGQKACELSWQMQKEGLKPDPVTFVGYLNACASVAALNQGRHVHEQIIQHGCESEIFVANSLIDMYAKCGSVNDALKVFNAISNRDVVSWNVMLGGYAMHGHFKEALGHFEQMCKEDVEINGVTFVLLLSACSHAGLVDEGLHYYEIMSSLYKLSARVEHCSCMVDLLGRSGRLHEAEDLMQTTLSELDVSLWVSLLGASRIHGNIEMGEYLAKQVLKMDPRNTAGYVLLSNLYTSAGNSENHVDLQ